jgi:hypothetical protein
MYFGSVDLFRPAIYVSSPISNERRFMLSLSLSLSLSISRKTKTQLNCYSDESIVVCVRRLVPSLPSRKNTPVSGRDFPA